MEVHFNDGKYNFTVKSNVEEILKKIEIMKSYIDFSTDYVHFQKYDPLTKEEFLNAINDFEKECKSILVENKLLDAGKTFIRKKNGTYNRRAVKEIVICNASQYFTDFANSWSYWTLQAKAIDDTTLEISLENKVYSI